MSSAPTPSQKNHWTKVAELGCILTGQPAEIAHCHGGSVNLLGPKWRPGWGQRQNHWLVIPLGWRLHRGKEGLDTWADGVVAWEAKWATNQLRLLHQVSDRLGYSVFEKAGIDPAFAHEMAYLPPV